MVDERLQVSKVKRSYSSIKELKPLNYIATRICRFELLNPSSVTCVFMSKSVCNFLRP